MSVTAGPGVPTHRPIFPALARVSPSAVWVAPSTRRARLAFRLRHGRRIARRKGLFKRFIEGVEAALVISRRAFLEVFSFLSQPLFALRFLLGGLSLSVHRHRPRSEVRLARAIPMA